MRVFTLLEVGVLDGSGTGFSTFFLRLRRRRWNFIYSRYGLFCKDLLRYQRFDDVIGFFENYNKIVPLGHYTLSLSIQL